MIESGSDLRSDIKGVARNAVRAYAQSIVSAEWLEEQILMDWEGRRCGEDPPSRSVLIRIAQRICSQKLYEAWRSSDSHLSELAFENLRRYLEFSLSHSRYAQQLAQLAHAVDDVLNQTLVELHQALLRTTSAGPDDPAAFLKWTQTIVLRQAHTFLQKNRREQHISLDNQPEGFMEQFVDSNNADPQEQVVRKELQETLKNAILSLKNPRYRDVLLCTYLAGIDEGELASRLGVQVQDVYMWRHRALKALRSKPEVMQALWPWLR
ncbi:MAG TPA: sigma-70 family RNA polymerase sigma factor [Ktedonobacteraceae bacterium]|nr:sigma-70 family RNA polymerase sigma factor [Ktedonobacteraceae bacterium]